MNIANLPDTSLFKGFQSLGDNCEFASVQERAGLKRPLTLLSYATTSAAGLATMMADRFAAVEQAASLQFKWSYAKSESELHVAEAVRLHARRFRPFRGKREEAAAISDSVAMLRLLRRRLLTDFGDPNRIFVFKTDDPDFDLSAAVRLHAAMRPLGPAGLLCVTPALRPDRVGEVEDAGEGLYLGWIDRFGRFPDNAPWEGSYDVWRTLCRQARRLHDAATGAAGVGVPLDATAMSDRPAV